MTVNILNRENRVVIHRKFAVSSEAMFRAWTDPQVMKEWLAPDDDFVAVEAEAEPVIGGAYRVRMHHAPSKRDLVVHGMYREVLPPHKLVFSWEWDTAEHPHEMQVTVEIHDQGTETELDLTHERFLDRKSREEHAERWEKCLDRLEQTLAR